MRRGIFFAALFGVAVAPCIARAEPPANLPPYKLGLTPYAGVGAATFTSPSGLPSFVGLTMLGVELQYHLEDIGIFARAYFLSSGGDGRWTAPALALGGSYNLAGDGWDSVGIYARGALVWENWRGVGPGTGCNILLFVPSQCPDYVQPPAGSGSPQVPISRFEVTSAVVGIAPGVRLEMPLHKIYVAFDLELVAASTFSSDSPGAVFEARGSLVLGLRDRRPLGAATIEPAKPVYRPRR